MTHQNFDFKAHSKNFGIILLYQRFFCIKRIQRYDLSMEPVTFPGILNHKNHAVDTDLSMERTLSFSGEIISSTTGG